MGLFRRALRAMLRISTLLAMTDVRRWKMENFWPNFIENFISGIPNLLTALVIFIGSVYLARVLSNLVRRLLERRKAPSGVTHLLAELVLWSVVAAGTVTALQRFFDVTAFL